MKLYHNKEWLRNEYINKELPIYVIAEFCNVGSKAICDCLIKYNIPIRSHGEAIHLSKTNHCNLSQEAIEWINGELLGDGCLVSQSKHSAKFQYGSKYLEYIEYVRDTLKSFGIEQAGKINKQKDKKYGSIAYHYNSLSYPELLTIREQWYPNNKKIIPKNIELSSLLLRQHYIGDGCLIHKKMRKPYIKLCTYGFSTTDVEYFIGKLKKMGIKANKDIRNGIYISVYSVKDFLKYIGMCPVKCYQYKWEY